MLAYPIFCNYKLAYAVNLNVKNICVPEINYKKLFWGKNMKILGHFLPLFYKIYII